MRSRNRFTGYPISRFPRLTPPIPRGPSVLGAREDLCGGLLGRRRQKSSRPQASGARLGPEDHCGGLHGPQRPTVVYGLYELRSARAEASFARLRSRLPDFPISPSFSQPGVVATRISPYFFSILDLAPVISVMSHIMVSRWVEMLRTVNAPPPPRAR